MRILHTMLRVGDLDRSDRLLHECSRDEGAAEATTIPKAGSPTPSSATNDESEGAVLELTHNWDTKAYEHGSGYGHVALEVDDAYRACDEVRARGGKVTREAGPMKHGTTVIAFVEDPDGYKIEFIQKKTA